MKAKTSGAFLAGAAFLFAFFAAPGTNPVEESTGETIPENLNSVFQTSCKPCHWQGGKFKSTFHVNFSKWDNYGDHRQMEKAKKICSELMSEDMPPETFRKMRPERVPTKEQVDAICKWSESLASGQ